MPRQPLHPAGENLEIRAKSDHPTEEQRVRVTQTPLSHAVGEEQGVRANPHLALLETLPVGRSRATTGRELAAQLITAGHIPANQRDPARIVRQLIHDLRALGVPICADSTDGFYLPENPAELREYLNRLAHRLKELAEPFRALKHTYQDWAAAQAGQTSTQPEHEPLSHIPEPYRKAYIHRIKTTSPSLDAASHAASHPNTPSPFTERGQGGEVLQNPPATPTPLSHAVGEGQGVRAKSGHPTEEQQGGEGKPNIPQLIPTLLPRLPVKPTTTPEEAANWLQMELAKRLREKPYHIYLPLAYMNREGWNRGAIAQHIKDWLQHRKQQLKQQSTLFKEDTTDETH